MHRLGPGERASFTVLARRRWNDSGVLLESGRRYRLTVAGIVDWKDWWLEADPETGVRSVPDWLEWPPVRRLRRVPTAPLLALVGCIGRDPSTAFRIGRGCDYAPATAGELSAFANDVPGFYWNNSGRLSVRVEVLG